MHETLKDNEVKIIFFWVEERNEMQIENDIQEACHQKIVGGSKFQFPAKQRNLRNESSVNQKVFVIRFSFFPMALW